MTYDMRVIFIGIPLRNLELVNYVLNNSQSTRLKFDMFYWHKWRPFTFSIKYQKASVVLHSVHLQQRVWLLPLLNLTSVELSVLINLETQKKK